MSSYIRAVQAKWGARRSGGTLALTAAEAPAVAVSLGGLVDVEEDAPNLLVIGAAASVEEHAAAPPLEELGAKMALKHADAVADGGRGDAELFGGAEEAPVAGGGLEEAQAVERRQRNHESGRREPWGWGEINIYFVIAQIHLSLMTSRGSHAGAPFRPCGHASRGYFSGTRVS